ncbi:MAG TPA: hypothetical protein VHA13_03170, partial [Gammaproteobacteria bacterium]|nr:hypothetical protein [Gammaproteobacteria bacterium]
LIDRAALNAAEFNKIKLAFNLKKTEPLPQEANFNLSLSFFKVKDHNNVELANKLKDPEKASTFITEFKN